MSARRVRVPSLLGDPGVARACSPSRRFLFAVPPLDGHVTAVAAVAAELARRGHKVAWTGHRASSNPGCAPARASSAPSATRTRRACATPGSGPTAPPTPASGRSSSSPWATR
ncbi:hypothetical protein ACFQY7_24100 [Actinomadura luteofluorescens]|uniref:hypothetical protein n=1 Tax=Actinomadura luteofluorescens TaxID=46163 RepID=UPI0036313675